MKKILLIYLIFFSISISCKTKQEKEKEELEKAITVAENSPITEKSIFLGFFFGMTPKDADKHTEDLVSNGKMYTDEKGYYTYDFQTHSSMVILNTRIKTYFEQDSLYKMEFLFVPSIDSYSTGRLNCVLAAHAFMATDHVGFKTYINEISEKITEYFAIKDNLIIKFDSDGYGRMSYINAPIERRIIVRQEMEADEKASTTVSDFGN